jgi:sulfur carrier protein
MKPRAAGVPVANILEGGCVTAISLSTSECFSNAGWVPALFPPEKASLHTMAGSSLGIGHNRAGPRTRKGMVIIWRSMNVIVNGQERQFPELSAEAKLSNVIDSLALKGDRIAVEHNGVIVPRPEWESVAVVSGDKLEIVHFVGGGAF